MYEILKSDIPELSKLLDYIDSKSDGVKWEDMQQVVETKHLLTYITILKLNNLIKDFDVSEHEGMVIGTFKDMVDRFRKNNGFQYIYDFQEQEKQKKKNEFVIQSWEKYTFWITPTIAIIALILSIYNTFWSKSGK